MLQTSISLRNKYVTLPMSELRNRAYPILYPILFLYLESFSRDCLLYGPQNRIAKRPEIFISFILPTPQNRTKFSGCFKIFLIRQSPSKPTFSKAKLQLSHDLLPQYVLQNHTLLPGLPTSQALRQRYKYAHVSQCCTLRIARSLTVS